MKNEYETGDMPLAAYLSYKGFILEDIKNDETREGKKMFVFIRKKSIDTEIRKYQNCKAKVEPIDYWNSLRNLKNRLYNQ